MTRLTRDAQPVTMREPAWWYEPTPGAVSRLLGWAGALWGWMVERRFRQTEPFQAAVPVICIGNFTVGGTGKTPLALEVAGRIAAMGLRPGFLSRGYGGRLAGPHWVDPSRDRAGDVGDEPLMLAASHPTLICSNRPDGARAMTEGRAAAPPIDVIIMDDGLQNPGLAKSLTLAVVDGTRGVGNGRVIPAGPLRAPLGFQLAMVDAIVVNLVTAASPGRSTDFIDKLRREFEGPVLEAHVSPDGATDWLGGAPIVAFAGIGVPDRLFATLEELGARPVAQVAFPDHHPYTAADANRLLDVATSHGAMLVTTEKDRVRLAGLDGPLGELYARCRALPIRMTFEPRDESRLVALLEGAVGRRTPKGR